LRSLVGDDDSADVALLAPDAALRGEPVHRRGSLGRCRPDSSRASRAWAGLAAA
ncbi:unnamed protein product, partial [Laminaria digitata]